MTLSVVLLAFVTLQRLSELLLSRRNTKRLLAQGAVEHAPGHYPVIVALHAAWLVGLWALAWDRPLNLEWLIVFIVLQAARMWVLWSLGSRWTTRIIVLPGAPLVRRGPYRFLRHPNYTVVAGEILALPMAFGLPLYAALFSFLNAVVLAIRIRAEQKALDQTGASSVAATRPTKRPP